MREGGTVSGAYLCVDTNRWADFLSEVKEAPRISGVGIKEAVRASFKKSTAEMIGKITGISTVDHQGLALIEPKMNPT